VSGKYCRISARLIRTSPVPHVRAMKSILVLRPLKNLQAYFHVVLRSHCGTKVSGIQQL
jgi:hypothetical protein